MNMLNLKKNKPTGEHMTRPVPKGRLAHQLSNDPFLDWVIILIIFLILIVTLVGVGISVYLGMRRELMSTETVQTRKSALPISETALDKVLDEFSRNSGERAVILRSYNAPRDPSLP
ncbi:MAG: hypothetical protein NT077_04300 [Candidatus Taylorbacteria bacterium]|nr:hypothetical protein [Candidatus Taylorbacteria bacterium]